MATSSPIQRGTYTHIHRGPIQRVVTNDFAEKARQCASAGVVNCVEDIPDEKCRKKYDDAPEVGIAIKVISISQLDMANNTFQADFNLNIAWKGEWKGKEEGKPDFELQLYNMSEQHEDPDYGPVKKGEAGFDWYYRIRFKGIFRQHYCLRTFPFDQQRLCVRVRLKSECLLVPLPWGPDGHPCSCDPDSLQDDFELKTATVEHTYLPSYKFGKLGGYDPEAVIVFTIKRNHEYWVHNYGYLLSLVCTFCFAAFTLPVSELGDRLSIGFTLNLTVIATFYLMQDKLPPVSYYTELERHLVVCIAFTMVVMVINCLPALIGVGLMEWLEWLIIPGLVFIWVRYHFYAKARAEALAHDSAAELVSVTETFSALIDALKEGYKALIKAYKLVQDKRAAQLVPPVNKEE